MDIPLVGGLTRLDDLREEYTRGNQTFVKQVNYLVRKKFHGIRRTRGDGKYLTFILCIVKFNQC